MRTRFRGNYTSGFYKLLNTPKVFKEEKKVEKKIKKRVKNTINNKPNQKQNKHYSMDFFIQQIKYLIVNQLKTKITKSPICVGRVPIDINICNYLTKNFNLTCKYKDTFELLNIHNVPVKRYQNENDFCVVKNFFCKITKPKTIKMFGCNTFIKGFSYLCYKFLKSNEVNSE